MGLFGASPADNEVGESPTSFCKRRGPTARRFARFAENATSEKNETEKWDLILDICDKAGKSPDEAKNYLKAVLRRLNHPDPHVAIQAATVSRLLSLSFGGFEIFFVVPVNFGKRWQCESAM